MINLGPFLGEVVIRDSGMHIVLHPAIHVGVGERHVDVISVDGSENSSRKKV